MTEMTVLERVKNTLHCVRYYHEYTRGSSSTMSTKSADLVKHWEGVVAALEAAEKEPEKPKEVPYCTLDQHYKFTVGVDSRLRHMDERVHAANAKIERQEKLIERMADWGDNHSHKLDIDWTCNSPSTKVPRATK